MNSPNEEDKDLESAPIYAIVPPVGNTKPRDPFSARSLTNSGKVTMVALLALLEGHVILDRAGVICPKKSHLEPLKEK